MLAAPFPGLRQLALFAVCGLAGAWLTVVAWFPFLVKSFPVRPLPARSLLSAYADAWTQGRLWTKAFLVLFACVSVFGVARLSVNDDLSALQTPPVRLAAEEKVISSLLGIGFSLLKESVVKVLHPTPVVFSWLTVAVLIASILVKLWMSGFNRTIGRIIGSETLIATAADSRNDVLSTSAVLIAAVLCRVTGWDVLDGLMGVGVAAFILISGWGLVMDTLSPLLGESPSEDLVDHIEQKVLSYPGVLGMHDLMVHDYGPGHQFASLHVELPAEQDPLEAHDLIDNIERDFLKNDRLLVTIHYDPIVTSDSAVGVLRARLTEKLRQLDPELSLHDLRIVPGRTHTNVLFDLVLPAGYAGDKVELLEQLEQFIKEQDTAYSCIIKVEQSYTAAHK